MMRRVRIDSLTSYRFDYSDDPNTYVYETMSSACNWYMCSPPTPRPNWPCVFNPRHDTNILLTYKKHTWRDVGCPTANMRTLRETCTSGTRPITPGTPQQVSMFDTPHRAHECSTPSESARAPVISAGAAACRRVPD